jgi:hypothetical protein
MTTEAERRRLTGTRIAPNVARNSICPFRLSVPAEPQWSAPASSIAACMIRADRGPLNHSERNSTSGSLPDCSERGITMAEFIDRDLHLVKKALAIAILAIERQPGPFLSASDQTNMKLLLDRLIASDVELAGYLRAARIAVTGKPD